MGGLTGWGSRKTAGFQNCYWKNVCVRNLKKKKISYCKSCVPRHRILEILGINLRLMDFRFWNWNPRALAQCRGFQSKSYIFPSSGRTSGIEVGRGPKIACHRICLHLKLPNRLLLTFECKLVSSRKVKTHFDTTRFIQLNRDVIVLSYVQFSPKSIVRQ